MLTAPLTIPGCEFVCDQMRTTEPSYGESADYCLIGSVSLSF